MGLKCGTADLSNVGKSTLFNALIKAGIETANFPFCTIEPSTGVVPVSDPRLDQLVEIVESQRMLPTTIEFVDIAGLVRGASKGEDLGNQFLTNIRETKAIGHVARCSENDNIIHASDKVNLADDIEVINTELALADLDTCGRAIHRVQKKARGNDKNMKAELAVLERYLLRSENAGMLRALDLSAEEKAAIRHLSFLTLKPTMYIASVNEDDSEDNLYFDQMCEIAAKEGSAAVPVCATVETDIVELDDEERDESTQEFGLGEPSLNRVTRTGCKLLNLQTYSTAGVKEVRTWTVPVGTIVPQAADKIHTDFEKGFIRAQTISLEDFIAYKGEQGAKETDRMCAEGKDYVTKDGNVMNFPFNV